MILVSYSLYGDDPKYIIGAIKNAELVQKLGCGWQAVFYLAPGIPIEVEMELVRFGALVKHWKPGWHHNGMFWRFSAINDFDYDFVLIRDVDSRISDRELSCLDEWFKSGKTINIIRDHPHHNALILGGLWGVSSKVKDLNIRWNNAKNYGEAHGEDQLFLRNEVFPNLKKSMHINDTFFSLPRSKYRFTTPRNGLGFVGESVNENEHYDESLRDVLNIYLNSRYKRIILLVKFYLHKLI